MSKRAHPDAVAEARAAFAAKYAKLNSEQKSPKAGSHASAAAAAAGAAAAASPRPPSTAASPAPTSSPAAPAARAGGIDPEFLRRIEAAKASAAARAAHEKQRQEEAVKRTKQAPAYDPRGGLEMGLHPALQGDLMFAQKGSSQRSKFATTQANRKEEPAKSVAKSKQLELLSGPEEGFTDREKNPYYDPKLGGRDLSRPVDRRSKALAFSEHGKYILQGDKMREEANLKALQERIAQTARRAGLEDDLDVSGRAIAKEDPPEIEWWDAPYTINSTYDDIDAKKLKIKSHDSPITVMIEHPIPMPSPADIKDTGPAPLKFTKKEFKKMRNQNREALRKDKQDKQRLGLIAADPPKVKLSNMATVLAHSSVADPTKVEAEVRAQVQARKDQHEQANAQRKLTQEEKKAKAAQKLAEDEAKGIRAAAWRIETMANGYLRKRVDDNAQQCGLSGIVILNTRFNLVYAEGGAKSLKFFKKLMEERIDWTEEPRNVPNSVEAEAPPDYAENKCTCVWEGELKRRTFGAFRYKKCAYEADVKDALKSEVYHLWTIAKNGREE